ncbi:hypothetical protein VTK73DRAFT_2103 [Phialemonium thermophilum]|uniref:Uncharacterized protein n=1 Tax=Phialemonium thermophilum TaxID=223376 RepID=A0ABR3VSJ3_9PEZI
MRYEDWDVLLFPTSRESKVPFKEFRVGCQAVPDAERSHSHGSACLPLMTCFVPSIQQGSRFHISIHCWNDPGVTQATRTFSQHPELVKLEARVFIDGRIVASTVFDRCGPWPHLIYSTFDTVNPGELAPLRFPQFRREILYQDFWNPADDLGRIKVVISEGFPRDSFSTPIERVNNVVGFSFQHAPLDILERNGVAWPHPSMWTLSPALSAPSSHRGGGTASHSHSPRRRPKSSKHNLLQGLPNTPSTDLFWNPANGTLGCPGLTFGPPALTQHGTTAEAAWYDNTNGAGYGELAHTLSPLRSVGVGAGGLTWLGAQPNRSKGNTDTSMLDLVSEQESFGDPMHLSGPSAEEEPAAGPYANAKPPANLPTAGGPALGGSSAPTAVPSHMGVSRIPADLADSLTRSLLARPPPLPLVPQDVPLPRSDARSGTSNPPVDILASSSSSLSTSRSEPFRESNGSPPSLGRGTPGFGGAGPLMLGTSLPALHVTGLEEGSPGGFPGGVAGQSALEFTTAALGESAVSTWNLGLQGKVVVDKGKGLAALEFASCASPHALRCADEQGRDIPLEKAAECG